MQSIKPPFSPERDGNDLACCKDRPAGDKQDLSGFYLAGAELLEAMFSPVECGGAAAAGVAAEET